MEDIASPRTIDTDTNDSLKAIWHARPHRADAFTSPAAASVHALNGWDSRKQRPSIAPGVPANNDRTWWSGSLTADFESSASSQTRPAFPAKSDEISNPLSQPQTSHQNIRAKYMHGGSPLVPSSESYPNWHPAPAFHNSLRRQHAKPAVPTGGHQHSLAADTQRLPVIPDQSPSDEVLHLSIRKAPPLLNPPITIPLRKIAHTGPVLGLTGARSGDITNQTSSVRNSDGSHRKVSLPVSYGQPILPRPSNHQKTRTTQTEPKDSIGKITPSIKRDANGQFHAKLITTQSESKHSTGKLTPSTKRDVDGQPKVNGPLANSSVSGSLNDMRAIEGDDSKDSEATDLPPTTTSFADGYKTYVPSNWAPSLPNEIIQVLQAMRRIVLPNGVPNRSGLKKWADETLPGTNYFVGHGNLGTTSPLWDFTLDQLGFTREAWRYLNRTDKPLRSPGPGGGPRIASRPSMPLEPPVGKESATAQIAPNLQDRSSAPAPPQDPTSTRRTPRPLSKDQENVQPARQGEETVQGSSTIERTSTLPNETDAATARLLAAVQDFVAGRYIRGTPWDAVEDDLLIHLKEDAGLTWHEIGPYFSYRVKAWSACQARYSSKLSKRKQPPNPPRHLYSPESLDRQFDDSQTETEATSFNAAQPRKSSRLKQTDAASRIYRPLDYFREAFHGIEREQSGSDKEAANIQSNRVARREYNNITRPGVGTASSETVTSFVKPTDSSISRLRAALETDRYHAALSSGMLRIAREPMPSTYGVSLPYHLRRSKLVKRRSISFDRPYLSANERGYLYDSTQLNVWDATEAVMWQDAPLHVDFSFEETEVLKGCVYETCAGIPMTPIEGTNYTIAHHVAVLLMAESRSSHIGLPALLRRVSWEAIHTGVLNRTRQSIECFLHDQCAQMRANHSLPTKNAPESILLVDTRIKQSSIHRSLRHRERGKTRPNLSFAATRKAVYDTLGPYLSFTGTSSDVNAVAWSPNGRIFAAGSTALTDSHSMQYNRPGNLLLGDTESTALRELPHHATKRPITELGASSTRAMYVSQDPLLFQSVSTVAFSIDGTAMFSAGYDNTARIYDVRSGVQSAYLKFAFNHRAPIDVLAVSDRQLFATGCAWSEEAIRVFRSDLDVEDGSSLLVAKYSSPRARDHPDKKIVPTSLKWGRSLYAQSRYLLCGFSAQGDEFGEGEVCVWDVEVSKPLISNLGSRNIFDVAWSPSTFGRFAVARTPGEYVNRGTRSVVQLFDSRSIGNGLQVNAQRTTELECPALDVNDVVFNPIEDYLISVGCTDSSTYMWDVRMPGQILHRLAHGSPLLELDEHRPLEEVDTGIRYLSWDATYRSLITGSSDGVVAKWDPHRASEDAFESTIAQLKSGVMSGAFNADFSNLLLGEVNGTVSVLAVGRDSDDDHFDGFDLRKAYQEDVHDVHRSLGIDPAVLESGIAVSKELLASGAMQIKPFGDLPRRQAVQGDLYHGPYDAALDATKLREEAQERQRNMYASPDQCQVEHEIPRMTEEGQGDNKASKLRIPESFRYLPVRERIKHMEKHMSCFRRDHRLRYTSCGSPNSDVLICSCCNVAWRMDLLGYTLLDADGGADVQSSLAESQVGKVQGQARPVSLNDMFADIEEAEETEASHSELQGFDEYVHSFWQDRVPSPL